MALLDNNNLPPGLLTAIEQTIWNDIKPKLAPIAWAWFNEHKNDSWKLFKFIPISVGSFGLVEFAITSLFGPDPSKK